MGSWAYCRKCDYGFSSPTIVEALTGDQVCPRCSTIRKLDQDDIRTAAQEIEDRLTALEKKAAWTL